MPREDERSVTRRVTSSVGGHRRMAEEVLDMLQGGFEHRKGFLIFIITCVLLVSAFAGAYVGIAVAHETRIGLYLTLVVLSLIPLLAYLLYKQTIFPYYRRLEDANLGLHLKQEELLDTKDDLFIKFLGVYDVNYAANSPRLFADRLRDVADVTARVMDTDACCIYLYDAKKDELVLAATNAVQEGAIGKARILLGEGIEGWVGRRLEPVMLKDFHADARYRDIPGFTLSDYLSVYCLPLYVYSNGALVGLMEVFSRKTRTFTDEEINFFTTLSGILSTTIQNEQMQVELRKMNLELEQWVMEKTEELRASEERYRKLVENARESIFVLAENGDIIFANDEATRLSGYAKYDLLHKNLFELFSDPVNAGQMLSEMKEGRPYLSQGRLRKTDGTLVPVDISAVRLTLMGKHFIQSVIRDSSSQVRLELLLAEKDRELSDLKARLGSQ
jgi:PAS domain S-box-containing protein